MNSLKDWVVRSRKEQLRAPERYLASYPELFCDETHVLMTRKTYEKIKLNCGRYDGTYPTGAYLGKMFLRGDCLCWFSISKEAPMTETIVKARIIQILEHEDPVVLRDTILNEQRRNLAAEIDDDILYGRDRE